MTRRTAVAALSTLPIAWYAAALQQNRISPHETVSTNLNGKGLSITYGRPYLKGREFGSGVAPYGQVWRLGADEATKLTLTSSVKVQGGPELAAGSYSLGHSGQGKVDVNCKQGSRYLGNKLRPFTRRGAFRCTGSHSAPVEEFTITLKKKSNNSAEISFAWGTQMVSTTLMLA